MVLVELFIKLDQASHGLAVGVLIAFGCLFLECASSILPPFDFFL